ncbi:MAG: hypothetical protein GY929_18690 [Actinomycetia bacterium]|nr:hypothetical protein [Actinomycetes bacterium]
MRSGQSARKRAETMKKMMVVLAAMAASMFLGIGPAAAADASVGDTAYCQANPDSDSPSCVEGEVVTSGEVDPEPTGGTAAPAVQPAAVKAVVATQSDGLGGAQGALALTGGDAIGLSVIGATLLGAGAIVVAGTRRKASADS